MKKILTLALVVLMLSMMCVAVSAAPAVTVDGTQVEFDAVPYVENGKVFIPFRKVAEALGISVQWDEETRTVIAMNTETAILIQIDNTFAFVNSNPVTMDAPAIIKEDRTYVSFDFLSANLGVAMAWDEATETVTVTTAK